MASSVVAVAELAAHSGPYTLSVDEVDGNRVEHSPDGVIVDAGHRTIGARYCNGTESAYTCSLLVRLDFAAESGKTYEVRRDEDLTVVLREQESGDVVARSKKKAAAYSDYEACVSFQERSIGRQLDWGGIKEDEAERLKTEAQSQCHDLVWGEATAAE